VPQSLQDIRRRIRSVQNTEKITAAMKMVAAAKLRRAQERAQEARPYAQKLRDVLVRLAASAGDLRHPLLVNRPVRRSCILLVTADRGLAGPYNANLIRTAAQLARERSSPQVVAVGRKGRDYFRKRGFDVPAEFVGVGDDARWELARDIGREVVRLYLEGQCDEVLLVYAQFVNALTNRPRTVRLLPLAEAGGERGKARSQAAYIFEPDAETVLARLLPHYIETLVYGALLDAKASEHGSRMAAMDNATKNAGEVIQRLTLLRNRVRQAAITKEIAEIVGGAEALTKA
jgi:F-type H+-transporting ATPase subunit gamma